MLLSGTEVLGESGWRSEGICRIKCPLFELENWFPIQNVNKESQKCSKGVFICKCQRVLLEIFVTDFEQNSNFCICSNVISNLIKWIDKLHWILIICEIISFDCWSSQTFLSLLVSNSHVYTDTGLELFMEDLAQLYIDSFWKLCEIIPIILPYWSGLCTNSYIIVTQPWYITEK